MTAKEFMAEMRRLDHAMDDAGIVAFMDAHQDIYPQLTADESSELEGITQGAVMWIDALEWEEPRQMKKAA